MRTIAQLIHAYGSAVLAVERGHGYQDDVTSAQADLLAAITPAPNPASDDGLMEMAVRKYGEQGLYAPHRDAFVEGARAMMGRPGWKLVPIEPTEAMLRPFYECPPDELPLAWAAALRIARPPLSASPEDKK